MYAALAVCSFFFAVPSGHASTTDTLSAEDFHHWRFPPQDWQDQSYNNNDGHAWSRACNGLGGRNGSALCDMYDGANGQLLTPDIDPGGWGAGDTLFLDFDLFWEYNYNNNLQYDGPSSENGLVVPSWNDYFQVLFVQGETLDTALDLTTSADYTYYNYSWTPITNPPTGSTNWRHYHIAIPSEFYSTEFQVAFQGTSGYRGEAAFYGISNHGYGNAAIDNVVITGGQFGNPILSVSPTRLFWRTHSMEGSTLYGNIMVTNAGTGLLEVSPESYIKGYNASAYEIQNFPEEGIPAGDTDTMVIAFRPNYEGLNDAALYLLSNGGDTTVQLAGIGTIPHILVTPNRIVFDSLPVGLETCQSVTISNTGSDTLRILGDYFSGADVDFTMTPLTGSQMNIAPGDSETLSICFAPARSGTRVATLEIRTNIPTLEESSDTSVVFVSITGSGVGMGVLTMSTIPDTAFVGLTNCIKQRLTNNGESSITITSVTLPAGSPFEIGQGAFPLTIASRSWVAIPVCFTPVRQGDENTIAVLNGISNDVPISDTVMVYGVGFTACATPSAARMFDGTLTLVGTSDTETVVITNCSDAPVSFTASLSGNSSAYRVLSSLPTALILPDNTVPISVVFTPASRALYAAQLSVRGTDGLPLVQIPLGGIGAGVTATASGQGGDQPVGSSTMFTVSIANSGNIAWVPGNGSISGTDAADFTIVTQVKPASIPAGSFGTLEIQFRPSSEGSKNALLTFPSAAPLPAPVFSYPLSGNGVMSAVTGSSSISALAIESVYPNPSQGELRVAYTLPGSGTFQIAILNAAGTVVRTLKSGAAAPGRYQEMLDVTGLASGSYFCELSNGAAHVVCPITIEK